MFGQALAITGINIRSIPERWTSSLVIVIGLAAIVIMSLAVGLLPGLRAQRLKIVDALAGR